MSTSLRLLAEPELIWLAAIVIAALASVGAMRLRLRQSISAAEDVVAAGLPPSDARRSAGEGYATV